ncbi:MAG: hypothetical protein ACLTYN_12670 [Dysosmobacter welbionis]
MEDILKIAAAAVAAAVCAVVVSSGRRRWGWFSLWPPERWF